MPFLLHHLSKQINSWFIILFGKNKKKRLNFENEGAKVASSSAQRDESMPYVVQKLVMLASKSQAF